MGRGMTRTPLSRRGSRNCSASFMASATCWGLPAAITCNPPCQCYIFIDIHNASSFLPFHTSIDLLSCSAYSTALHRLQQTAPLGGQVCGEALQVHHGRIGMHTALEKDLSWATLMRLPLARPSCRAPRRSSRVSRAICLSRACSHAAGIYVDQQWSNLHSKTRA